MYINFCRFFPVTYFLTPFTVPVWFLKSRPPPRADGGYNVKSILKSLGSKCLYNRHYPQQNLKRAWVIGKSRKTIIFIISSRRPKLNRKKGRERRKLCLLARDAKLKKKSMKLLPVTFHSEPAFTRLSRQTGHIGSA